MYNNEGYHHRQRVFQPSGLEKAQRTPFGLKPGGFHLAISPEASIWIEARRAGTTSAGVEGPGSKALKQPEARRADTPWI